MFPAKIIFPFLFLVVYILTWCSSDTPNQTDKPSDTGNTALFKNVTTTHLKSSFTNDNTMDGQAYDIDQDGDIDMILAMEFRRNRILINNGEGILTDETDKRFPDLTHDSEDIAIADFDQDGDPDIIFVSEDDQVNEYYRNTGQGFFEAMGNVLPVTGISNTVETYDFNNDDFPDLIIGNQGQNYILINNRNGGFDDETSERLPVNTSTTQDLELYDIDADGDPDIIEANETNNRILINKGSGFFNDESSSRLPDVNDQTREVDLGDIDNDGDPDLFFANVDFGGFGNPQNRILINDGQGVFTEITQTALPQSSFRTVEADFFDINKDGWLDIISGNRFNGNEMLVLINNKSLIFTDQTNTYFPPVNSYVFDFQFADFNADGLLDVYFCNFRGGDSLLFREK